MAKRVTVFGATGMVGGPAVRRLVADGHSVTAVARDPGAARAKLPDGVRVARGDVADPAGLRGPLADAEAAVVIMPLSVEEPGGFNAERDGTRNIVASLPAGGRARVVKLSEIGAGGSPGFRDLEAKADAERAIAASGHPHVILRPTWFMEAWVSRLRAGPDFLAVGKGRRAIHWVALDDMARWLSRAVDAPGVENRTLTAQGADALAMPVAAARLAEALGAAAIPVPADGVVPPGAPEGLARTLRELFRHYEETPEPFEAAELWRRLGEPEVRFGDFVARLASGAPGRGRPD